MSQKANLGRNIKRKDLQVNSAIKLLQSDDPAPFEEINRNGPTPLLLLCDHASRRVPLALGDLGLKASSFDRHIAYDIGAESVSQRLSRSLDAPLVAAGFSRLVIDLNRPAGHQESIVEEIDATPIPANQDLNETAKRQRITELFKPYHDAVDGALARLWERGTPPAIFSVHSFSPDYGDTPRPWDIGVLWNRDPRIAVPLMDMLKAHGLNVGDNEPYSGQQLAYTIDVHGGATGLANCVIEINQDQVRDAAGIDRWATILEDIMPKILKVQGLHRVERF